jgi:HAD superfamily hydrolase (TIGR01509 family)
MIKTIIFDRDGVLTHFDHAAATEFFSALVPYSLDEIAKKWVEYGKQIGFPRTVQQEKMFFSLFWERIGIDAGLPVKTVETLKMFDYATMMRPYPEAASTLEAIRNAGLRIGVLSNFSLASLDHSLTMVGLRKYVDRTFAATVIGYSKPDGRAYLTAARCLATSPQDCLMIDDERPNCAGALEVGMKTLFVDRRRSTDAFSSGVIHDLSGLSDLLRQPDSVNLQSGEEFSENLC